MDGGRRPGARKAICAESPGDTGGAARRFGAGRSRLPILALPAPAE
jgi:hypothetical protein